MSISVVKNPVTNKYTVAKDIDFRFNEQPITFITNKCYINGELLGTLTGCDVLYSTSDLKPKDK